MIAVPSAPPTIDSYSAADPTTLFLSWSAPQLNQQNGIIRHYYISLDELETESILNYTTASSNMTVTSLHPDYHYRIEISAVTVGAGPSSMPVTLQMPEDGKLKNNIYKPLTYQVTITYLHTSSKHSPQRDKH